MTGNVKESGARLENALINGGGNLKGIGSTLEGLDVMQFPYEYILEKAWNLNVDDNKWIECLADRHVGCVSQSVRDAWNDYSMTFMYRCRAHWVLYPGIALH